MRNRLSFRLLAAAVYCLCLMITVVPVGNVSAAQLPARSVQIGRSTPGAQTDYTFGFTLSTTSTLGSIELEFCSNNPLVGTACTAPSGFSLTGATLGPQSGETGFSIDGSSTVNRLVLTRVPGVNAAIPVSYRIDNVTNPTAVGTTYVRISTFASSDASGPRIDSGGVAFSTTNSFTVNSFVPPYLTFCVGVTIAADCSTASGDFLNFGELNSKQTRFLTSQFGVATNDPTGYSTTVAGISMVSGNNIIPALASPTPSFTGVSQFGMNLRANSAPPVGADPTGVGAGATIAPDFAAPNAFTFKNGVVVSSPLSTDFNTFTVSYIVNVSSDQHPGVYSTTLTYIATAAF